MIISLFNFFLKLILIICITDLHYLQYKAYRYMITLLLYSNYLTIQIYNTE